MIKLISKTFSYNYRWTRRTDGRRRKTDLFLVDGEQHRHWTIQKISKSYRYCFFVIYALKFHSTRKYYCVLLDLSSESLPIILNVNTRQTLHCIATLVLWIGWQDDGCNMEECSTDTTSTMPSSSPCPLRKSTTSSWKWQIKVTRISLSSTFQAVD